MRAASSSRPPLTPRYWPGWLGIGVLWLAGKTPQRIGLVLSVPLGALLAGTLRRRRRIAERNLERCFPEHGPEERERLLKAHFRALARMIFEVAWSWSASPARLLRMANVEGQDSVREALSQGRGVLVITGHFTCLEIGGRLLGGLFPDAAGVYRPLRSPVLEWYQNRSRAKYSREMIGQKDMRKAIRFLRDGGVLWYAPDQDFGSAHSVFVPFFGIQTATLKATERMVRLTDCAVVPMFPAYNAASRKYSLRLYPALENFPSGDIVADLSRISALIEAHARKYPDQYWWIHRRFKTRPEPEPPFYD